MLDFAESLLPQQGYICVGELQENFFRNHWIETPAEAVEYARRLNGAGCTVFIAQGSYAQKGEDYKGRGGVNVTHLRNFFLDIDCGESKPYPTQKDGLEALFSFCKKVNFPAPSVVNSGNGLYAHWILNQDLPAAIWKLVAGLLQKLVKHYEPGLDIDGICADRARVLRPVGTTNRKKGEKPVTLVRGSAAVDAVGFCKLVKVAAESINIPLDKPRTTPVKNAEFLGGLDTSRPSSAYQIADKCAQVALVKEALGNVAEPLWYATIGLLRLTTEAPDVIHAWSQGYPDYTYDETARKIAQQEAYGPATCTKLHQTNPGICEGCQYVGKIVSPITLGYVAPTPLTEIAPGDVLPETPSGFTVSLQGVFYEDGGESRLIYPYPLWVSEINSDYFGESFTIRHKLPHDGWREVTIASNKMCEPKAFFSVMFDSHIGVVGKDNRGLFMAYIETFMAKLRSQKSISKLSGQMGWRVDGDKLAFVHGAEVYQAGGVVHKGGYSATAPEFIRGMTPTGDSAEWIVKTEILNRPGMEGLAFQFLAGAFGAPLVRFTGFEGMCLAAVGASGVGKTLVGKWGLSAWGDPKRLMLLRDDTRNMLVSRLGVYNNLPAYIDEVTNILPLELSEIVFKITQGRDRGRLNKNAVEKKDVNGWNTLAIVSSNASLSDKLMSHKGDADAELNRLFEFEVHRGFTADEGRDISRVIEKNYGVVGKLYARWLVENQDKHEAALAHIVDHISKKIEALPEERFWLMCGAVAIYGGMIAEKIGVSHVHPERLIVWVCSIIKDMRKYKQVEGFDAISFLGSFLDKYANAGLVVGEYKNKAFSQKGYREPYPSLFYRIELDKKRLWISYTTIKQELQKIHVSTRKVAQELITKGLLKQGRINLGRGTAFQSISQYVWELDLSRPELGFVLMNIHPEKKQEAVNA